MANAFDEFDTQKAPVAGEPLRLNIPNVNAEQTTNNPFDEFDNNSVNEETGNPFVNTFKQGLSSLGDIASNDLRFVTGHDLIQDPAPMQEVLKKKYAEGTANRLDYQRAFLEGFGNSPGGKFLGAVGGVLPEANVITTALTHWVNPWIEEKTDADPSTVQLAELAGLPVGAKVLGPKGANLKGKDLPSVKAADMVKDAVTSPMVTAGKAVELPVAAMRTAASPVVRSMMGIDNPITGTPGISSALETSIAKEGSRLESAIPGLKFTMGEKTGHPMATGIEDSLANSYKWRADFAKANQTKIDAIVGHFNRTLDEVYSQETVPENFGRRLSSAYNGSIDSLNKIRQEQAKIDFDAAYEGSKEAGQYIKSDNTFRTLQDLREEGSARLLTKSKEVGGKEARKLLSKVGATSKSGNEMATNLTIQELGNALSDFGAQAMNKEHPEAVRRVYARIYDSLNKDLDSEIANPKGEPQRIAMLKVARDNYRGYSNKIADLQKTTLGNLIGYAARDSEGNLVLSPEVIATKFQNLHPSELRGTLKFLDDNHPEVAQMGRRYVLEQSLRKAQEGVGQRGIGTTKPFAKADFVKGLPSPDKMNIMFKDSRAHEDITDVSAAINRMIDWGASEGGSQTFGRSDVLHHLMGFGKGLLVKSLIADNVAKDLLDPSRRHRMGVESRQWNKMLDTVKTKGVEFLKDESGSFDVFNLKSPYGKTNEVLQNPSYSDLLDLAKEDPYQTIRTLRNGKGIYAWKGDSDLHHWDVHNHTMPGDNPPTINSGFFELKNGKLQSIYKNNPNITGEMALEDGGKSFNHNPRDFAVPMRKLFLKDESGMGEVVPFKAMKSRLKQMRESASGPRTGVFDMKNFERPVESLEQARQRLKDVGQEFDRLSQKYGMLHPATRKASQEFGRANDNVIRLIKSNNPATSAGPDSIQSLRDAYALDFNPKLKYTAKDIGQMNPREYNSWIDSQPMKLGKIDQNLTGHMEKLDFLGFDNAKEALKAIALENKTGFDWQEAWGLTPEEAAPIRSWLKTKR